PCQEDELVDRNFQELTQALSPYLKGSVSPSSFPECVIDLERSILVVLAPAPRGRTRSADHRPTGPPDHHPPLPDPCMDRLRLPSGRSLAGGLRLPVRVPRPGRGRGVLVSDRYGRGHPIWR